MNLKIKVNRRSRKGNLKPSGLLIINTTGAPYMTMERQCDLSREAKRLLDEAVERGGHCVLTFGAGVSARYIKIN